MAQPLGAFPRGRGQRSPGRHSSPCPLVQCRALDQEVTQARGPAFQNCGREFASPYPEPSATGRLAPFLLSWRFWDSSSQPAPLGQLSSPAPTQVLGLHRGTADRNSLSLPHLHLLPRSGGRQVFPGPYAMRMASSHLC